jgi:hypothetical protein
MPPRKRAKRASHLIDPNFEIELTGVDIVDVKFVSLGFARTEAANHKSCAPQDRDIARFTRPSMSCAQRQYGQAVRLAACVATSANAPS